MDNLVIYHDNCWDGITSAYIASKSLINVLYVPWSYNHKFIKMQYNMRDAHFTNVYVLDIACKSGIAEQLQKIKHTNLIWIDHHLGSECEQQTGSDNCKYIVDHSCCAAQITWRFFNPDTPIPYYVQVVNNHDLFIKTNEFDECIRVFLFHRTTNISFSEVNRYFDIAVGDEKYNNVIRAMITYGGMNMMQTMVKNLTRADGASYKLWKSRAGEFFIAIVQISEPSGLLLREQTTKCVNFVRDYMQRELHFIVRILNKKKDKIIMLRSASDSANAHEVASAYGGGGHLGAATYTINSKDNDMV